MYQHENRSLSAEVYHQPSQNADELGLIMEAIIQEPDQELEQIADELSVAARQGIAIIKTYLQAH